MNRHKPSIARPAVRVLLSLSPPDGTTKFVNQIVDFRPDEESVLYFSWWRALFCEWDVFHVHWPEFLIRGSNPAVRFARTVFFVLFLTRLTVLNRPIVRTVHNLEPHARGGRLERTLLAWLYRRTTLFVLLNAATPLDPSREAVTILHGHYVNQFKDLKRRTSDPLRLLYFGRIEPYKGVDDLLEVFSRLASPGLTLRIVGKPTPNLRDLIESYVEADPRVSALFGFVPDAVMVEEISGAGLVVLPYREMHNSGVVLVALSLGRPVLAPRTPANELIESEVGSDWMILFDGTINEGVLDEAVNRIANSDLPDRPEMPDRDWASIGESHYQAYLQAVSVAASKK